jgi:hypothetical protein
MSGSNPLLVVNKTYDAVEEIIDDPNNPGTDIPNPDYDEDDLQVYIAGENTGFVYLTIADLHNQPMPAGTTITFSPSVGGGATPSSFDWPSHNRNGGLLFPIAIKGAKEPTAGVLNVTVETPSGVATSFSPVSIVIQ